MTGREVRRVKQNLCTVFLFLGHVEVINKDDGSLSNWRTKYTFPTSVQFGHDDVLCLIGRCPRREVDVVRYVPM